MRDIIGRAGRENLNMSMQWLGKRETGWERQAGSREGEIAVVRSLTACDLPEHHTQAEDIRSCCAAACSLLQNLHTQTHQCLWRQST